MCQPGAMSKRAASDSSCPGATRVVSASSVRRTRSSSGPPAELFFGPGAGSVARSLAPSWLEPQAAASAAAASIAAARIRSNLHNHEEMELDLLPTEEIHRYDGERGEAEPRTSNSTRTSRGGRRG